MKSKENVFINILVSNVSYAIEVSKDKILTDVAEYFKNASLLSDAVLKLNTLDAENLNLTDIRIFSSKCDKLVSMLNDMKED